MKRFKSIAIAAFVVLAAASAMPALPAAAESASLSIVPKKNYTIEAGKSAKDTLTIRNLDDTEELQLSLRVVDFTYTDDGGTPKLMLAENAPQTTWSLKSFLTVPKSVTIPAKSSKTLDISVAIPAGHGAGSYYSAIVYSTGASDGANVGLSASGVTLVFTSIPGDVKEELRLEKFGAYNLATPEKKAGYTFITSTKPEAIAYTLKNNGNVTEAPVGSITLKHMFGKEQQITDVNPNGSLAIIGQTRTFTTCIKSQSQDVAFNGSSTKATGCSTEPNLWPGMYTAKLDVFYGQNGNNTQEIVSSATFWYLPWWFVITFLVVLAVIAFAVWRLVVKVRRRMYGSRYRKSTRRR